MRIGILCRKKVEDKIRRAYYSLLFNENYIISLSGYRLKILSF